MNFTRRSENTYGYCVYVYKNKLPGCSHDECVYGLPMIGDKMHISLASYYIAVRRGSRRQAVFAECKHKLIN